MEHTRMENDGQNIRDGKITVGLREKLSITLVGLLKNILHASLA